MKKGIYNSLDNFSFLLLTVLVSVILTPSALAYPYKNGAYTPDELIKVLKIDLAYEKEMHECKIKQVRENKNRDICEEEAIEKKLKEKSKLTVTSKRLQNIKLLSESTVSHYCNLVPADKKEECNLASLAKSMCEQNYARLVMFNYFEKSECGIDQIDKLNGFINIVRLKVIEPLKSGVFSDKDYVYKGEKEKPINELLKKILFERSKFILDYVYWDDGSWVRSEWGNDGLRDKYNYNVPDGYQLCRLESFNKKERQNAKVRNAPIVFDEDKSIANESKQRIKGWEFDLNAIGGSFWDQYSSTAAVSKILISYIPDSYSLKERRKLDCFILKNVEVNPVPTEEDLPDERDGAICGLLKYESENGDIITYRGVWLGSLRVIFSEGGIVTSSIRQNVSIGSIYNYDRKGGDVGFNCG